MLWIYRWNIAGIKSSHKWGKSKTWRKWKCNRNYFWITFKKFQKVAFKVVEKEKSEGEKIIELYNFAIKQNKEIKDLKNIITNLNKNIDDLKNILNNEIENLRKTKENIENENKKN